MRRRVDLEREAGDFEPGEKRNFLSDTVKALSCSGRLSKSSRRAGFSKASDRRLAGARDSGIGAAMKQLIRAAAVFGLAAVMLAGSVIGQNPRGTAVRSLSVLVLLGEWFGDAYFPLKDEIEARGWTMKRVGVDLEYRGCYNKKRDVVLRSDILIPDLKDLAVFDALIIPSGPQFRKFREDPAVLKFIRDAHAAGLVVASFCVGNFLVQAAGLADGISDQASFPKTVTLVKERVLLGPRGGGPPPGDGFESAPIKEICDAIAGELDKR
jgi:hypothetical protein